MDSNELKKKLVDSEILEDVFPYGTEIKLSEDKQAEIISEIKDHVSRVKQQRSDLGIEEIWSENLDLHEGETTFKDFPFDDCSNLHVHITAMSDNILIEKIKTQVNSVPSVTMLPTILTPIDNLNVVTKKEKYFEARLKDTIKFEEAMDKVYFDAVVLGTGVTKEYYDRHVEMRRVLEIYEAAEEDIYRFIQDFAEQSGTKMFKDAMEKFKNDVEVEVWVDKPVVMCNNPVVKYVKVENLYLDCYVTDINDQKIIAEKIEDISWEELERYTEMSYFNKDLLKEIKETKEKFKEEKYTIWECNYLYQLNKKTVIRTVVTFFEDVASTKVARIISFPYAFAGANYTFHTIIPSRDHIYGQGLPYLLRDTNLTLNALWNQAIDAGTMNNAPMFKMQQDSSFDPTTKKMGPATIFSVKNMTDIDILPVKSGSNQIFELISRIERYGEWLTGISAYMTGRESALDPNAPASKAFMLLKEANVRINAYIKRIHQSNLIVFRKIEALEIQYFDPDNSRYLDIDVKEVIGITRREYAIDCRMIPTQTDITLNKSLQKEENMRMGAYLQAQGLLQGIPKIQRKIIEIQLRSAGGDWDKYVDVLLPSEESVDNPMSKLMELTKIMPPQAIVQNIMARFDPSGQPIAAAPMGANMQGSAKGMFGSGGGEAPSAGSKAMGAQKNVQGQGMPDLSEVAAQIGKENIT